MTVPRRKSAAVAVRFCHVLIRQIFNIVEICQSRDHGQTGIDKWIASQANVQIVTTQVILDLIKAALIEGANLPNIHNLFRSLWTSLLAPVLNRTGKPAVSPDRMLPDMEKFAG